MKTNSTHIPGFLAGNSLMISLSRDFDWDSSALGPVNSWSLSLRTNVGTVLHSAIPMLLFWGPDMICFYNDAFLSALPQNNIHPAIAHRGAALFPASWPSIITRLQQVISSRQGIRADNETLPFLSGGSNDAIFWTSSYSPVFDDEGEACGVLITCYNTTAHVQAAEVLKNSRDELHFALEAAELATYDLDPATKRFTANARLREWFGLPESGEVDLDRAILSIEEKDRQRVLDAIFESFDEKSGGRFSIEYTILNPFTARKRIISAKGQTFFKNGIAVRMSGTLQDITRETEDRNTFNEEKERRALAIAAGEFGVYEVDIKSGEIITDQRFNEIFGLPANSPRDEFIARCHPDDRWIRDKSLKESLETGVFDYTARFYHTGGDVRWLRAKGNVVFSEDGEPLRQYGIVQDVTREKQYLDKIAESQQRMKSMIESAPFPIGVYIGREMRVEFVNKSIIDIWGKGPDIVGKLYREVLPELSETGVYDQLDQVFVTGKALHIKNQRIDLMIDNELKVFYFDYSFTPLFDTNGEVYGVMNTAADLTELNLAKLAIQKSEENLRNTILQAPVAMCMFKGDNFVVELANERIFELWGRPAEDILHKPIFEGLPEARGQGFEELLSSVYHTGKTFSATGVPINLPRNGKLEQIYVNFVYEPYRETDGRISGVLAVAIEVTAQVLAQKQIEELVDQRTSQLAEANQRLQRSNAELAQFAYIASHDLQEPLRKISTYSQLLESTLAPVITAPSSTYLDKIRNSAERMTTLIRDVLNYSAIVRESDLFTGVDLDQILTSVISDYELLIEQKQAVISADKLPVIEAISLQMSQLFSNLISNSLKYTKPDQPCRIRVALATPSKEELEALNAEAGKEYIKIVFSDNGIGFRPEFAHKIFNIFQRLHRKSEYEGTGIGLAMCRKIVSNHSGSINAEGSQPGSAVFNVILPVKR